MKDYFPVSMPRYSRYAQRLRASRTVRFPNDVVFQDHIRQGDLEQVGRFIRARKVALDTIYPSGMAALHEAVLTGNLDCVKLLVKYGADIHQRDENGWTPLHMACSDGYADIARYLMALGASPEATTDAGEKPSDLIDPEYRELLQLFQAATGRGGASDNGRGVPKGKGRAGSGAGPGRARAVPGAGPAAGRGGATRCCGRGSAGGGAGPRLRAAALPWRPEGERRREPGPAAPSRAAPPHGRRHGQLPRVPRGVQRQAERRAALPRRRRRALHAGPRGERALHLRGLAVRGARPAQPDGRRARPGRGVRGEDAEPQPESVQARRPERSEAEERTRREEVLRRALGADWLSPKVLKQI